jgi:hypothetical protein
LAFGAAHFWDKEDPSAWTPDEISQLSTNSPWAKQVNAELKSNESSMAASTPRTPGRGGRRSTGGESAPDLPKFQGIVRWASAAPIREALKLKFPDSLTGHYVISVSGLPVMSGAESGEDEGGKARSDSLASLKEQASLQLKRGEPIQPGIAYEYPDDTSSIYFGFLPQLLRVSEAKTALFAMSTGPLSVRAKFNLEQMKYRGELAV